jgi:sporulation protein YlmC with PRC-barrel domain
VLSLLICRHSARSARAEASPLDRVGRPMEVGDTVAYLCSPRAGYVNGVTFAIDGGVIRSTKLTGGQGAYFTIDEKDQGKTVVDHHGEEVGIVSDVEAGTMYVDPHPSLTDKIRAKLDWGDADEDSYPLAPDQIEEITRDRVRIHEQD